MRTLPSIQTLGATLGCEPEIEAEHPELGVLGYRVWYESDDERVELSVSPVAEEIGFSLITKNPTRIVRLKLQDVSELAVSVEDGRTCLSVNFHTREVEPLHLSLGPPIILRWGNFQDSPDRHLPWDQHPEA